MIAPVTLANAIADAVGLDDLVPPFMPGRVWQRLQGRDPDAVEADAAREAAPMNCPRCPAASAARTRS